MLNYGNVSCMGILISYMNVNVFFFLVNEVKYQEPTNITCTHDGEHERSFKRSITHLKKTVILLLEAL